MFNNLFKTRTKNKINKISPPDLHTRLHNGDNLIVLDVRSADEYGRDGHIAGSRLMPLNTLPQRASELPRDQTQIIICVCRSGARSQIACETLAAQGFTNVLNMSGGMIMWRMNGLPIK